MKGGWAIFRPQSPTWHPRGQGLVYRVAEMKETVKAESLEMWLQCGLVCKRDSGNWMEVPLKNWWGALMIIFTSFCTHPGDLRIMGGCWREGGFPLNITKILGRTCIINHERGYERAYGLCYTISHVLIKAETMI